jgi:hypothetical protein
MHLELNATHLWASVLGFTLGALLLFVSMRNHWRTSREFRRYKAMLSDKLELEQKQMAELSRERERLLKDNENLRVKVLQLNERPDNNLNRDLEVYARAEKQMKINAPGFAGAWELAKEAAQSQIAEEERGNSLPQRIFRKLLGGGPATPQAGPAETTAKNGSAAGARMTNDE